MNSKLEKMKLRLESLQKKIDSDIKLKNELQEKIELEEYREFQKLMREKNLTLHEIENLLK